MATPNGFVLAFAYFLLFSITLLVIAAWASWPRDPDD